MSISRARRSSEPSSVLRAAAAMSTHPLATHAVGECVGQLLEDGGVSPDLVVLGVTDPYLGAMEDIASAVRRLLEPVVLIGAGIGLTPIFSMLSTLVHLQSRRPVWFFYGVRNRTEHLFKSELAAIMRDHPHFQVRICYSQPGPDDRQGGV